MREAKSAGFAYMGQLIAICSLPYGKNKVTLCQCGCDTPVSVPAPPIRDGLRATSRSWMTIPATIAATNRIVAGRPSDSEASAGPGQSPTSPQPMPKIAEPTISRLSMS